MDRCYSRRVPRSEWLDRSDSFRVASRQVDEVAASLNSGDCFVLLLPSDVLLWKGALCSTEEAVAALAVGTRLKGSRALAHVVEGEEPAAFWAALGGEGEYTRAKDFEEEPRDPLLFHCANASGAFKAAPINIRLLSPSQPLSPSL